MRSFLCAFSREKTQMEVAELIGISQAQVPGSKKMLSHHARVFERMMREHITRCEYFTA